MEQIKRYFFYVLLCADQTLYGGFTIDLKRRLNQHNAGTGAKYTRNKRPVKMIYHEEFYTKSEALKAEYAFKHQTRSKKELFLLKQGVDLSSLG